jgi:hypothetical protein
MEATNESRELAFKKAQAIIASCTKCKHLRSSKRYIGLYHIRFEDDNGYNTLYDIYITKKTQLKCAV